MIISSINKYQKLSNDYQQKFRWMLNQMVQLMPFNIVTVQD